METLHPALVHFAIVLPIVALTFQVLQMRTQKSCYGTAALITLLFTTLFIVAAWFSGKGDAKDVFDALMANTENGADALKAHAQMGQYLMIGVIIITLVKLGTLKFKQTYIEVIVMVALLAITPAILLQGKSGGEIVYKHGSLFDYPETDEGEA